MRYLDGRGRQHSRGGRKSFGRLMRAAGGLEKGGGFKRLAAEDRRRVDRLRRLWEPPPREVGPRWDGQGALFVQPGWLDRLKEAAAAACAPSDQARAARPDRFEDVLAQAVVVADSD
ncbi:MAG: hypothetical protein JRI97_05095 [Deltaproteobacteria bacterium]|nr:hypothetical protein [Deltaproteobacteria bacterium]